MAGEGYKAKAAAINGVESEKTNAPNENRYDRKEPSNGNPMNTVTFDLIGSRTFDSGYEESTVTIFVDGQPLASFLQAYEKPFAVEEGHPGLAGDYHAITVASSSLTDYYLGKKDADWGEDGHKTLVLGCDCGIAGCWPLVCNIRVEGEHVIWSGFEQPHRVGEWNYSQFDGFVFDKQQYVRAIDTLILAGASSVSGGIGIQ